LGTGKWISGKREMLLNGKGIEAGFYQVQKLV
jgi:hypothetical protein